jgi:phage tail sheath protein FI
MSAKKFKFVSPGVFLSEIDNSQLPAIRDGVGPVIIGRTRRGPAMKPVKVSSFQEFVEVFGEPIPGNEGQDPWRDGNGLLAPAYAPYAAQAYLKADIDSPVTVIRLAGVQGDDASDAGQAGWEATNAFGLFVGQSGSSGGPLSASLAAIVYTNDANFEFGVNGALYSDPATVTSSYAKAAGSSVQVQPVSTSGHQFTIALKNNSSPVKTVNKTVSFRNGKNFIRDVLNTNPVATNSNVIAPSSGSLAEDYWLGETFEEEYERIVQEVTTSGGTLAMFVFAAKLSESMEDFKSDKHQLAAARSGWVIPQYNGATGSFAPENLERLFRFIAIQEGEQGMDLNIKIANIKIADPGSPSSYGRFDVVVEQRRGDRIYVVDSYENLNLNPNSNNFIARRIGDQYFEWDAVEKRNKVYGNYPNQSSYIRVEMSEAVGENGPTDPASVPFGFFGPIVPTAVTETLDGSGAGTFDSVSEWLNQSIDFGAASSGSVLTLKWPQCPRVVTGSRSADLASEYILGSTEYLKDANGTGSFAVVNKGMKDHLRRASSWNTSAILNEQISGIASTGEYSYIFSMDEVFLTGTTTANVADLSSFQATSVAFISGSQRAGTAYTSLSNASASALASVVSTFSMPLAHGFDGVDVTEADPFNMRIVNADSTTRTSYAHASIDRAIELVRDPEAIEMNLAAMPGITNASLTTKLIQTCEARADALAIIDLPDVYIPPHEQRCSTFKDRVDNTNPEKSAKALKARQINSSYGATYYPWVKVRDTINSRDVWAPPSVIALGVMGYTEQRDEVWFAPAGFNRGGLNEGNAGLPVLQASEQLLSSQRDTLYEANINPIASFVSEGLVVFGQKTLQMTPSALDRINVRRLLIFVKKEVSRIASGLLFDQNLPATWNRFTGQVVPFLESVKTRLGLADFKVVLDRTTTTPDLIDRNIMYAKIFLKPARAIEFIAVDFVITRSGASFED